MRCRDPRAPRLDLPNGLGTSHGDRYGDDSYIGMFVVMGGAILLAVVARVPRLRAAAAAAVVVAFFAAAYGVDASYTTLSSGVV